MRTTNQRKCLLGGSDWDVLADLPEWDSHPSIIKETRLRPRDPFSFHTTTGGANNSIQKQNGRGPHLQNREKYLNLTKELEDAGYKAVVMPVEVSARGFIGSSVYDLSSLKTLCYLVPQ